MDNILQRWDLKQGDDPQQWGYGGCRWFSYWNPWMHRWDRRWQCGGGGRGGGWYR
jgi:hypothetical protein